MLNRLLLRFYEWYNCQAIYRFSDEEDDFTVCRLRKGHKDLHRSIYHTEWSWDEYEVGKLR